MAHDTKAVGSKTATAGAAGAGAAAETSGGAVLALAKFDEMSVKQSTEPPAGYRRLDTGAEGFWRGNTGDVLHAQIVGPAHEGLAGAQYLAGGVANPDFPVVMTVLLLAPAVGEFKANETDKAKTLKEYAAGELLYVNVWHRTRPLLSKKAGTKVWLKVTDEKDIGKGKRVKIVDCYDDTPTEDAAASRALPPVQTAPHLS